MANEKQKCAGAVWDKWSRREIQCPKTGNYEHAGHWYCKKHHPPSVVEREAARKAKWDASWAARKAEFLRSEQTAARLAAALEACRQIAAGHTDPRALAAAVVAMPPKEDGE